MSKITETTEKIVITDHWTPEYITRRVETEEGEVLYQQTVSCYNYHRGTKTFLDDFLSRFNTTYNEPLTNGLKDAGNVIGNSGDLFYLISNARFKTFNLKQKFFHFLLKHIFLNGKPATIENIKGFGVNN